jgi:hypothetical protein
MFPAAHRTERSLTPQEAALLIDHIAEQLANESGLWQESMDSAKEALLRLRHMDGFQLVNRLKVRPNAENCPALRALAAELRGMKA